MRDLLLNPELRQRMERLGVQRAGDVQLDQQRGQDFGFVLCRGGGRSQSLPGRPKISFGCSSMMYMKYQFVSITPPLLLSALALVAAPVAESTLPNETLHYSVNWPSGVSLGEATLSASSSAGGYGAPGICIFNSIWMPACPDSP